MGLLLKTNKRLCVRQWGFVVLILGALPGAGCPPTPPIAPTVDAGVDAGADSVDGGVVAVQDASRDAPGASEAGTDAGVVEGGPGPGGNVFTLACLNLKNAGCEEGLRSNCASVLQKTTQTHLTNLHPDCLSKAHTKAELRACDKGICP